MDYQAFSNSVKRGVLSPVYIFWGSEKLLMNQMVEKVKENFLPDGLEAFNFDKIDGEKTSIKQVVDIANTMPVISDKRVVIVDNPPYLISSGKDKENIKFDDKPLLEYLKEPNLSTCLIFKINGKVDKRKKIYKSVQNIGQIIDFLGLNREKIEEWILNYLKENDLKIAKDAISYLALVGNEGLDVLTNELKKLILYAKGEKITLEMVQEIVAKTSEINVFNLIDNIAGRNGKKALEQLKTSLDTGEAPMKLVYLLVRQFRMILIAKDLINQGYPDKQVREKLEVAPFVVSKVVGQGRKFTLNQLVVALNKLLETERSLKSSGAIPDEIMENLVVDLCYLT